MGRKLVDIKNQNFGNLTAIEIYSKNNNGIIWKCICNICGTYCYPYGYDLRRGRSNFCCKCNEVLHTNSPLKTLYNNYLYGAINRNLEFEISIKDFEEIIKQNCHYCGTPPIQYLKKENAKNGIEYNGIDRINNSIGYIKQNCVPCCKYCNFAKGNNSIEDFLQWIDRLVKFKTT